MPKVKLIVDSDPESPREWDNFGTMLCQHRNYNLGDVQGAISELWGKLDVDLTSVLTEELATEFALQIARADPSYGRREYRQCCERFCTDSKLWAYGTRYDARRTFVEEFMNSDIGGSANQEIFWDLVHRVALVLPLYLYDHSGITMSTSSSRFRACDSAGWDWGVVGVIFASHKKVIENFGDLSPESLKQATDNLVAEVEVYDQYLTGDVWGYVIEDDEGEDIDSCYGFFGDDPEENGMIYNAGEKYRELFKEAKRYYYAQRTHYQLEEI